MPAAKNSSIIVSPSSIEMAPTTSTTSPPAKAKKPRKKKDPNAPAGVTSAYTWFFRATQATIKEKNPGAKFGDISKIVASMWEALGDNEKTQYKEQNEKDKIRHKREMEAYNAGVSFKKTPIKDNPPEDAENEETKEVFSSTNETLQIASHFKVRYRTLLPFKPDAILSLFKSSF
jgi:hypothetical protein